ncbi:hypothetical protein AMATHDRAFT_76595 [Amanita thiersii Skay4041]|uniref:Protein HGH1 homolog n=1 Tax=Amanita thiersii Skay4041 TaxID=703135 RepID=A0A2A9NK75_9AGAR|nr:hypothetical protein AMATHDRAFT_76595 [Amanita thiersii Skay4041]
MDQITQLRELTPFLRDRNPQVRQVALSNLLPYTPRGSPHRDIFYEGLQAGGLQEPKENNLIRDLKLLCRDQLDVAHDAFRALVNLSDSSLLMALLTESTFLTFIVAYIINPQSVLADLAAMLLSNLSSSSTTCAAIASMRVEVISEPKLANSWYPTQSRCGSCPAPVPYPSGEPRQVAALPLLLDAFIHGAQVEEDLSKRTRKGQLHFLASVFANLASSSVGRDFFFTPHPKHLVDPQDDHLEYPLSKIVTFTEHKDTIRRGGVASAIKNCAFHVRGHRALLTPESTTIAVPPSNRPAPGIDVLPFLLLPLAGPEEFDLEDQEKLLEPLQFLPPTKKREMDIVIRLTHVETLLLLCHTRWGRDYLRQHGVYEIVRVAHENESEDKVQEHIERLVQLIKGDESNNPLAEEEELEGTDQEANTGNRKQELEGTIIRETSGNEIDEDDIIEEV